MQAMPMIEMAAKAPAGKNPAPTNGSSNGQFGQMFNGENTVVAETQLQALPESAKLALPEMELTGLLNAVELSEKPNMPEASAMLQTMVEAELPAVELEAEIPAVELEAETPELEIEAGPLSDESVALSSAGMAVAVEESAVEQPLPEITQLGQQAQMVEDVPVEKDLPGAILTAEMKVEPSQNLNHNHQEKVVAENVLNANNLRKGDLEKVVVQNLVNKEISAEAVKMDGVEPGIEMAEQENIDPRFAHLLQPRTAPDISKKMTHLPNVKHPETVVETGQDEAADIFDLMPKLSAEEIAAGKTQAFESRASFENLVQGAQGHLSQGIPGKEQLQGKSVVSESRMFQLPSGQVMDEVQVVDQVVARISGSQNGESGRMVLRLNPAELGSLRLDLVVEGDKVRAHLQAQTLQVQEVLERNLPQLKESLAQQGLRIDEFKVNIDSSRNQSSFQEFARDNEQTGRQQNHWSRQQDNVWQSEELIIPVSNLLQPETGISLRV